MKKLITGAALVLLASSPVFAQTSEESSPSNSNEATTTRSVRPQQPRVSQRPQQQRAPSANEVHSTTGHLVGSDPDPHVRTMLQLDQGD